MRLSATSSQIFVETNADSLRSQIKGVDNFANASTECIEFVKHKVFREPKRG
jgi:hypothetical protein